MAVEEANTIKFTTVILLILGLIIPLWPISLPLFWYLSYKSYKKGNQVVAPNAGATAPPRLSDLKEAQDLLTSGVISQEEFDEVKAKVLGVKKKVLDN